MSDMNPINCTFIFLQMILQAKWMLRRPLKRKPAHCKYADLDDSMLITKR